MSNSASVLRKKLQPRPPVRVAYHDILETRCDEIIRKTTKSAYAMDVLVGDVTVIRKSATQALTSLPDIALTMMLRGPDGQHGLAVVDGELNDGLIEQQTLGRVSKSARGNRAVTSIDISLTEGFLRKLLDQLDDILANDPAAQPLRGYTYTKTQQDRPTLELILGAAKLDVLRVVIDMGPGVKAGVLELWYPAKSQPEARVFDPAAPIMRPHVLEAPTRVIAMLDPVSIPLRKMMSLEVGDTIALPRELLTHARLQDKRGKLVTRVRLGQLNGNRAARVVDMAGGASTAVDAVQPMMQDLTGSAATEMDLPALSDNDTADDAPDLAAFQNELGGMMDETPIPMMEPDAFDPGDGPAEADGMPMADMASGMPMADMSEFDIAAQEDDAAEAPEPEFAMASLPIDLD